MKISVVVPTYARPERLQHLLGALREQQFASQEFEVIVVDDGSPADACPEPQWFSGNMQLLRQMRQGPAAARNHGVRHARGALMVFTDDDCLPEPQWLDALWHAYQKAPDALLGGQTFNGLPANAYSSAAESLLHFFDEDEQARGEPPALFASNNLACDREALLSLGGFDTAYSLAAGEDRALCRDWSRAGRPLHRVLGARILHFHDHSLRSFWKQQYNYGRGAALFHAQSQAESALPREPNFYVRLLLHPLRRTEWSMVTRLKILFSVVLSQLAVAAGLIQERRKRR
jgi:GT2 family glycosyltransferase